MGGNGSRNVRNAAPPPLAPDHTSVDSLLSELQLVQYKSALEDMGCDLVSDMQYMTRDELNAVMKPMHASRVVRYF